jgi:phage shock protein PspC (stress-responsive transcriptional regulator)
MKPLITTITWIAGGLLVCLGFLLVGTAAYAVQWLLFPFKCKTLKPQK